MSDLPDETLAEWREGSLNTIRVRWGLEPEDVGDIADTRILALVEQVERAEAEVARLRAKLAAYPRPTTEPRP